jgi:antitoxin (DNA-binding transcriptional repressor) of toxin-antitoxin stability system
MSFTISIEEAASNFAALVNRVVSSHEESVVLRSGIPAARLIAEPDMPPAMEAARLLMGGNSDDDTWESDIADGRRILLPSKSPWD